MTKKSITLSVASLALLLCASVFAIGPAAENTADPLQPLSVDVTGCIASGTGDFICKATPDNTTLYNYSWQHRGSGQLYQTNSAIANITECVGGGFTLRVQVMDRVTRQKAISSAFWCACDEGWPGDEDWPGEG